VLCVALGLFGERGQSYCTGLRSFLLVQGIRRMAIVCSTNNIEKQKSRCEVHIGRCWETKIGINKD